MDSPFLSHPPKPVKSVLPRREEMTASKPVPLPSYPGSLRSGEGPDFAIFKPAIPSIDWSPAFILFVRTFRLAAKEAMFMRKRAKPGETIEFEVKMKDKIGGGANISGIPRMAWNNAYGAILAISNSRVEEFKRAGYIVPGTDRRFTRAPKVPIYAGQTFEEWANNPNLNLEPGVEIEFKTQAYGEYPYKFTTNYPNAKLPWSGAVLQMRSQYLSHLVKPTPGASTFRLHVNSAAIPGAAEAEVTWQQKFTNHSNIVDDPDNWIRLTISTEAPSHKPTTLQGLFTRYISRHSFIIDNARVDFSKVYSVSQNGSFVSHELEIEYIFGTGLGDIPYLNVVAQVIKAMFSSPVMFSRAEYHMVSALVTREMSKGFQMSLKSYAHINRELFSDAQTLSLHMWNTNFLFAPRYVDEPSRTFIAGLKIDGFKMTGIFYPGEENDAGAGTWLIFPPFQARFCGRSKEHARLLGMTVFECEIYTSLSGETTCWYIDAMVVDGENLRSGPSYMARRDKFRIWYQTTWTRQRVLFDNFPPVIFKDVVPLSKEIVGPQMLGLLTTMWGGRGNLVGNAKVDGIMFTPNWLSYNELCKEKVASNLPTSSDGLSSFPSPSSALSAAVYKWKPDVTIDFIVRKNTATGTIEVFTVDENQNEVQFVGTRKHLLRGVMMADIPLINDTVVEFSVKDRILTAYKSRTDKVRPNSKVVADDNWQSMAAENNILDVRGLLGLSNVPMRFYHNEIKRNLLLPKGGGKVLDLGFGRLGDGKKYMQLGYEMVIGVEPDSAAFEEAHKRLSGYTPEQQQKFHLAQLRAEDTENVVAFVTAPGRAPGGVDTIVMSDVLTFFFGPDPAMLKGLVATIRACLKPGGVFIWRCMYGSEVLAAMKAVSATRLPFGDEDSLEYLPEQHMIRVKIGRIEQDEYIVDMPRFMRESGLAGDSDCACREGMLSRDYRELSGFFYHGVFSYPERPKFPAALEIVFGEGYTSRGEGIISTSLIETIESLFTRKSHTQLLEQYWVAGKREDTLYPGKPLAVTKFESAGDGYFTKAYLAGLVDSLLARGKPLTEREVLTLPAEPGEEMDLSLAFASLLDIDVYVLSRLGGQETLVGTNAVHCGDIPRSCLLVLFEDGKYQVARESTIMPFFSSLSDRVRGLGKLALVNFCELAGQAGVADVRLPTILRPMTPLVYRMALCAQLPEDVRLQSLGIHISGLGRKVCTRDDLERVGLGLALVDKVNLLLK